MNDGGGFTGIDTTVYVPYFKSAATIGECVNALLGQTVKPAVIVVYDDASPEPLALALPGVQIVRNPVNIGLARTRNQALAACATRLLASVDADVVAAPDWLEILLAELNQGRELRGVAGRLVERRRETLADRWRARHMAQHWGDEPVDNPRFLYGANTVFHVETLRGLGGYDGRLLTNYEDMSLCGQLYAAGVNLRYQPAAACEHLKADTGASVLAGFWQWFHAKGLINGEFHDPEKLIGRIAKVSFGIHRYRSEIDRRDGFEELLPLDTIIPWVFCAKDLAMAEKAAGIIGPEFPDADSLALADAELAADIALYCPRYQPRNPRPAAWHQRYLEEFQRNLRASPPSPPRP